MSWLRRLVVGVGTVVVLGAEPAAAQGVGFQGGGTVSPSQFYVGSHFEVPLGSDQFLLRPGVEGGTGDGVTLASINFEFLYRYELPGDTWAIYQGTGPSVNFLRFNDSTTTRGGFNFVFGVRHENASSASSRSGVREARISGTGLVSRSLPANRIQAPDTDALSNPDARFAPSDSHVLHGPPRRARLEAETHTGQHRRRGWVFADVVDKRGRLR